MSEAELSAFSYDSSQLSFHHLYLSKAVKTALRKIGPVGRLLDAGCGSGALTAHYHPFAKAVYAFDLSQSGATLASKLLGASRVCVASAYDDFTTLFPDANCFDAIVSTEMIEHLFDPRCFVRRAREALAARGTLILTTPYHGYLKNVALAVSGKLDQHFTALWDGGHIKFWSRATLTTLLSEAGFGEFTFIGAGRVPLLWKSMVVVARLS
jgi:2-polyprenyl-3-methyl-5-hydroxy-6-metoxy-1,4-benzoquinol methylase